MDQEPDGLGANMPSVSESSDSRRFYSTTARRFTHFFDTLGYSRVREMSGKELQAWFREAAFYPARDREDVCIAEPPDVFFTYHSAQPIWDIENIVWNATARCVSIARSYRPDASDEELSAFLNDGIRFWIDFLFIDQSARDIRRELGALPALLQTSRVHFVMGTQPLSRAWCCYELALFNAHLVGGDAPSVIGGPGGQLRSVLAPTARPYLGWNATLASEPEDKNFIWSAIGESFPGSHEGFHHVMEQASATAVLAFTENHEFSTPAADELVAKSAVAWFDRLRSQPR